MKTIRRLLTLACALVAALAIAVPAYAADNHTITISSETGGHTFTAYQIFSGEYDNTVGGPSTLSNIQWGSGVNGKSALSALKSHTAIGTYFTSCDSAADVAAVLQNADAGDGTKVFADDSDAIDAFAAVISKNLDGAGKTSTLKPDSTYEYTITGLKDGYYLVTDAIGSDSTTGNAYSKFMIQLVGNVEVNAKADVPTITKKVADINDTTGTTTTGDSADYDFGDNVPFTITATVANNYADYDVYKLIIHDTLATGLVLDDDSVVVKIDEVQIKAGYTLKTSDLDAGCSFEVVFDDLKQITDAKADSKITVEYTATLVNNSVIGGNGNDNTATLEYSSNPNDTTGDTTAKTVSDTVTVFTYQVIINKVDDATPGNKLPGAQFSLQKKGSDGSWGTAMPLTVDASDGSKFTIKGLDDGTYKLTETNTPTGYNTMEPVEFTIEAIHDSESADPTLTDLTGAATDGSLKFTPNVNDGSLTATVVNERGATLPSTGGIGKTVLIGTGAVIAVVAVVGLVTKYRASRMD